jgi:lipopolysaccharide export LptBFGC system permease protein LptF
MKLRHVLTALVMAFVSALFFLVNTREMAIGIFLGLASIILALEGVSEAIIDAIRNSSKKQSE